MPFPTSTPAFAATAGQSSNWEMPQSFSTAVSAIYTGFTSVWHATHWLTGTSNPPVPTNIDLVPSAPKKTTRRKRGQNKRPADVAVRGSQRSVKTSKQFIVPEKPVFRQRRLEREGAMSDLGEGNGCPRQLGRVGLRREDSFVLVDHGDHFRMVKPMYAKTYYHRLPRDFVSIAPYHPFGPDIEQEMLRKILCAGVAQRTISRPPDASSKKRVRFMDEDEDDNHNDRPSSSKKARRS